MYKIIGADQKEYGPVSGDQIRQWISESRVNAQTQAKLQGSQEWQPLSSFPEFADAWGAEAAAVPSLAAVGTSEASGARAAALRAVQGPAIALIVTAILGLIAVALGLIFNILTLAGVDFGLQHFGDAEMQEQMQKMFSRLSGGMGIVQGLLGAVVGVVILLGASKMRSLQNHQFALTASILAMLPCISPCCLLGLPFGIWALVVLNRPEVKSQFI